MLLLEVILDLVGATPFETANGAFIGVVDRSDMSPGALPLGETFVVRA
jgi:hypothetical protein